MHQSLFCLNSLSYLQNLEPPFKVLLEDDPAPIWELNALEEIMPERTAAEIHCRSFWPT